MQPTTFCLVRHGETVWNRENRLQGTKDIQLSKIGIEQAKAAAKRLQQDHWDMIVSSDLSRAIDTARIINENLGIDHFVEPRLRERNFGILEGKTRDEIINEYPGAFDPEDHPELPGLENFKKVGIRIRATLEKMARQHPGKEILIVSHGSSINAFLYVITGIRPERIGNTSLTTVTYLGKHKWIVDSVNDTSHLESKVL